MERQAEERFECYYELQRSEYGLSSVALKVAATYEIYPDEVLRKGRQKSRVDDRSLFCYWAVRELKISLTDLARKLDMTVSLGGFAVQKSESIPLGPNYRLLE